MDKNDKVPSHNPEKKTDLIIISPEELVKLGLFQDFSALISPSTRQKTRTNPKDNPTASSSDAKNKSKTTPSKSVRKRSSATRSELCFKQPEATPIILPSSKQPVFAKGNLPPCEITHQKASESSKPVLKKNLEHMKQILTESISQSHANSLARAKTKKKQLKVISNNVANFSSKELKDIIGKAKIKEDSSTEISLTKGSGDRLYSNKPSLALTSSASTVTRNTSQYLIPKCGITDSQQFNSSLSDIQDKELEISRVKPHTDETKSAVSFNEYVEIAEEKYMSDVKCSQELLVHNEGLNDFDQMHNSKGQGETTETFSFSNIKISGQTGKDVDNSPGTSNNLKQEENTFGMQKDDFMPRRKKGNNSIQNGEVLKQIENSTQTKTIDTVPDPNKNMLLRKKDVNHIPNRSPKDEHSREQCISGDQQNSSPTSVLLRLDKDRKDSVKNLNSKEKEKLEDETAESSLLTNELIRSREHSPEKVDLSSQITENLNQEENTIVTKIEDTIFVTRIQHIEPLLVESAKEEAPIQAVNNQPFADTSEFATNNSEFKRNIDISADKPVEHLVSQDLQDHSSSTVLNQDEGFVQYSSRDVKESVSFSKELERSGKLCTKQNNYAPKTSEDPKQEENTIVIEKIDSILDRRRRLRQKPILIDRKKKADHICNNPVAETSNTVKNTPELNSSMDIKTENPVEHLISTEQLDSTVKSTRELNSTMDIETENSVEHLLSTEQLDSSSDFAKKLSSDVKEESKKETKENDLEITGGLSTEQTNYAPIISEDLKQKENTTVKKTIDSILDRRRRLRQKPILIDRKKDKAGHINNSPVAETSNTVINTEQLEFTVKSTPKLNSTMDIQTENPVEHLLSTEQLDSVVKNTPELNNTMNIETDSPVEHLLSAEQLDSSSDFSMKLSSDVKEESKKENDLVPNELERTGELSTEQINYAPKFSKDLKQKENTNALKAIDSIFDRMRRQRRKPILVDRQKDKAVRRNNNPVAETSNTAKNTPELCTMNIERKNPLEHLLSTEQLNYSSNLAKKLSGDVKEESKKETKENDSFLNELEISGELSPEQINYAPNSEDLKQEENNTVIKTMDAILDRKPILIDSKRNKADHTYNNPITDTSNTVKNSPELNSTMDIETENPSEHLLSTEQLDSSSDFTKKLSSDVKEESKKETKESVSIPNEMQRSELCTKQINYAPKISEDLKKKENTNITNSFTFLGIQRQDKKNPLVAKRKNKATHTNNNQIVKTSDLNSTTESKGDNPAKLVSTKQLDSPFIPVTCQNELYEDFSQRMSNDIKELKKETNTIKNTSELNSTKDIETENPLKHLLFAEQLDSSSGFSKRQNSDVTELKKVTKESVSDSSKLKSSKEMFTKLIETASEKYPTGTPLLNQVEVAESVSVPKIVKKRGRSKKSHLEISQLDESKETVGVLETPVVVSEIKNTVDEVGDDKIVGHSTEFEELASNVIHSSTPLSKKRGRRKKNNSDGENEIKKYKYTKSFTNKEKGAGSSTANEVILNDSSLLGTTQSDERKRQKSNAKITKIFTKDEKDANEVILNDSSLLDTTQSAAKKGKQSKVNNSKKLANEEKYAGSSTANEVILNDISLLGATQSDNDTTKFSTSVLKVAKKRGRPRKIPLVERSKIHMENSNGEVEEGKELLEVATRKMETEPVAEEGIKSSGLGILNTSGSTKSPRKRGRPRKTAVDTTLSIEPAVPYTIEKSRSGRTRKKVNYLDLELNSMREESETLTQLNNDKNHSSDMDDEFIIPKKIRVYAGKKKTQVLESVEDKSNKSTSLNDTTVASESLDSKNAYAAALPEQCAAVLDASSDISEKCTAVPGASSDISEKSAAVPDASSGMSEKCTAVPDASSDISENNEAKSSSDGANTENTNTPIKSKYHYHGYTTKMMNSVFSAAFRGDQTNSVLVAPSSSSSQEVIGKKRKGRPKLYGDDTSDNGISEETVVSCIVCDEKMINGEWACHNATRHYNLAWRKGELALNLDDDAVIKQKLKTFKPKINTLECKKCDHPCMDLESFIIHREECLGILVNGLVTCAVCNSQMDRQSWLNHKLKIHNNLAWRIGDLPLDLNNQDYVLSVLNALYKLKRPLFCDKCNVSKKSVVGFLSHRSQCGAEDAKVECKLCGKRVLPVSMQSHIKLIHENPKENHGGSDYFSVDTTAGRKKRRAAKGAMQIIDSITGEARGLHLKPYKTNPVDFKEEDYIIPLLESELKESLIKCKFEDCSFSTENVESALEHLNSCSKKPEEFHICTMCLMICVLETDIRQHLTDVHDVFLPNEEDSDDFSSGEEHEMDLTARKLKKISDAARLKKSLRVQPLCIAHVSKVTGMLFSHAFQFTWEFCLSNYNQPVLYDKFRHFTWNLLPADLLNNYLPVTDESCHVARIRVKGFDDNVLAQEHNFEQYDLCDVKREDEHTTMFCGGPITAMAWAPTPHTSREASQVLAVATCKDFDSKYRVNATYEEPSVIQFWDFGRLANRGPYPEPSQMLFLALECGPIWHLEWCPSGCYDEADSGKFERLGLLAVAGSVPAVFIYSIPMIKDEEKRGLFYKEEPLLKLQINPSNSRLKANFYPTKISWTKASGHKYIAVGYSDGMVALFDVHTLAPILIIKEPDGGVVLLPFRMIPAHKHYITVLTLVHFRGGDKLLLTGSYDKEVHVWNLDFRTKITAERKRIVTDGTWLNNWMSYVTTSDDSNCVNGLTSATVTAHRNYLSDPAPIMFSKSAINCITASDWLNGFVQGNDVGEVQASFHGQMLYSFDSVRRMYLCRYPLSYTKLIDKHKPPEVRVAEEAAKLKILTLVPGGLSSNSLTDVAENSDIVYNYVEPLTYAGARKKYGLVFCDFKMDSLADFPASLQKTLSGRHEALGISKPNLYSLQAANKVCFNPNRQASLYFATGYQAGFVRVSYLKFLERDDQIRKSM